MAKILNIDGTNYNQYFSQVLDNEDYILHIYYNARSGWYLSFYDASVYDSNSVNNESALIYGGRKLMPNQDVLDRVSRTNLPKGALFCYDSELKNIDEQEPLDDSNFGIGNRYNLIYFREEEITS